MSKSRRSLVRSTLRHIRQLWQRRSAARREVKRCLGSTFEMLEPRLALTIGAPLPSATDHIHPVLQIYLEGQQVTIPTDVGSTTSGHLNPHTHDLTGTLHIGEGGPAGIGTTVRNVTLQDFFDVWRTAGGPSGNNPNAIFDTDLTDGTNLPRIMDKTVNASTHVLRVYVKETGDSVPELEYSSNQTTNNLTRPELYVPRDGDQVIVSYDKIAQTTDSPSFQPIANQTVLGGAPTWLGIDGFDPSGGPLTYTVQVSNPSLLTATIQPSTNKSMVINVADYGQMTFQLFNNLAPRTVAHFETIINNGEYNNSTSVPVEFYRIAHLGDGSDFVIQGGRQGTASSLGRFDDEFNTELQFTSKGLLAMAKSSDDTNDAEIFITGGPTRFLDMQHTIFGVLTDGDEVRNAIQKSRLTGDGPPPTDIVITSTQIVTDNQNAALQLKAAEGASGTSTVTLTVSDGTRTFSQTFNVTVTPDTANSAPFLNPIAPITGTQGQPITVQLTAQDAENNAFFFDASKPTGNTVDYTLSVNNSTGLVTITPPANFVGTFNVSMGVRGTTQTTTQDQFDTQLVSVTVASAAPTVDLVAGSDSGSSNTDNITSATTLEFLVSGVTSGATVRLLEGTTVLATGTVPTGANTISLTVPNPGTNLGQGVSAITANQTVGSQTSATSTALNVTFDSAAPTFSSTAPTTAQVGFDLAYNAQTNEEGSGLVYTLTNNAIGATINSTTGLVTWTPTSTQTGSRSFSVVATDAAGNTATQAVTVAVATPQVDLSITLTRPDGTPLTSLSAGQDFVLHVFAADLRDPARGVFAAYTDITFDSTKVTITGPIVYSSTYASGRSGNTATAGLVDEVGAFAGTTELGAGAKEVFSIPMRATGSGTLTFSLNPAETTPSNDVLVYGQNGSIADEQIHYGTASVTLGSTYTAVNDTFNVSEDTQNNTINPLANDASIGGATNTLTISAIGTTSNGGTVSITQNSTRLNYTPAANFKGNETFTYTARNQNGEEQVGTITMSVADVNDTPVAVNDTFDASRNSTGNVLNVLANDTTGVDTGETLRVTAVGTGSRGGTITIGANGANIVYAPANNVTGAETFTYTISDRATGGLVATATVTMNVSGLTATPDTSTVAEDSNETTIDVLANDALDTQVGGTLSITAVGTTSNGGTVAITQSNTRITYKPLANFQGTETFTYTISDGQGHSATATVTMTVTNVNDPPVATNDTLTAFRNTTASFDVLANDTSGPDPVENLVIDSVTQPTNGTVTITDAGKKISFVPSSGFSGATSFTYTIKDPSGATATATANVTVQEFTPSSLAGFVYFDVNNNGVKDFGESPLTGVTITLTGRATSATVDITPIVVKSGDDGSYKFDNLAPGNYAIAQTQPLFTIDGIDTAGSQGGTVANNRITISTLAQATTGINNNFGEIGRTPTTISLRDFFSSTSRNYAHAAFDTAGNALWHSMSGSVWQSQTANTFSLVNNKTQIQLQGTNGQSQVVSRTVSASELPVYQSGQASGNLLYYIPSSSGTIPPASNQAPTGIADTYSTPINTVLTVTAANGVLKNDTDPENNTLTATVVSQPANGTLSLSSNGAFTFTPTTGFTGTTTFTYRASDGNTQSAVTTVTIGVGTGTAPTGVADTFTATEDTVLTRTAANGLLTNDTDAEGNTLTAVINTQPSKGTLSLAADGSFTYTPNANTNGADTFTYRASDGVNQSAVTTVTINVAAVNDAPAAVNDTFNTTRNTAINQAEPGVLINDTDVDSTTLTVTLAPNGNPTKGTLTLNPNGSFNYTPNTGITGTDTFTYRVSDGALTADGVATITINPPANQAPVAVNDTFSTAEDSVLTVATADRVLKNDTDAENNPLTAILGTATTHGTVSLNSDGTFTYTPVVNFNGTDSFTYRANDGTSDSTLATVTITVTSVNDVPVGVADTYSTDPDTALTVPIGTGILANDTDADGQTLTAVAVAQPTNGTLTLNSNGAFTYTPNSGFVGTDTFTYKAVDPTSLESAVTTVTIHVNTPPTAAADTYAATEDTPLVVPVGTGVLNNDSDANGDPLTAVVVTQPQNGTLTLNANGSFTYTPNANFSGADTFRYQATDGKASSAAATVTINVAPANDAPQAVADAYSANSGVAINITAANGVLKNDTDIDNDPLSAVVATQPANGTLTLNADGSFTYTSAANFHGEDTFTYRAQDGRGGVTAPTTVTIQVNAPPVAVNDTYTVNEDAQLVVNAATGVLDNDTDANSTNLTVAIVGQPTNGTITLNADGSFTYTPNANFHGTDGFSYTVGDGLAISNAAAVTITVNPVNDAPLRTAGTPAAIRVAEDSTNTTAVTLGLSGLTYGPGDGASEASQTLTFKVTAIPAYMTVFQNDGTTEVEANDTLTLTQLQGLTYKTVAGASGTGSLTWTVQDSGGTANGGIDTLTESLSVTVGDVNEAPVRTAGAPAAIAVNEDSATTTAVTLGLTALAYGPGGGGEEASQVLTFKITSIPAFVTVFQTDGTTAVAANDTLTLTQLQGLKYKTVANASGTGSITWTVQDDGGTANSGIDLLTETLAVTVNSVNDSPARTAGTPGAISVAEDSANTTAVTLGLSGLTYGPGGGANETTQTLTFKITAIPAFVTVFKADGTTAVAANDILTLAELQGLQYKTVADATGTGSLTWTVQDDGGIANGGIDTLTETLAITVNPINDDPARLTGTPAAINVNEDSANTAAIALGLSGLTYGPGGGTSEASQTLTFRITSIPAAVTVFQADGTTAVAVNNTLTLAQLQGLRYKTVANANGTGNLTWSVQDNGGTASGGIDTLSETLAITVNSVNDVPLRTAGNPAAIRVAGDSANTTAVTLGLSGLTYGPGDGASEASQSLTFRITAIPAFVTVFKADGTTAVAVNATLTLAELQGLRYKTLAGATGTGNLTWTVQDNGGTANGGIDTLTENLAIIVGDVNEAPLRTAGAPAAINVNEDSATTTAVTLGLTALTYGPGGSGEEASQTLAFRITSIPAFVTVFQADGTTAVAANSTLTLAQLQGLKYKTVADVSGSGNITWTVQDSGGTANGGIDTLTETLSVTVNSVNDTPARTAGTPAAISVPEDSANTTAVALGLAALNYGPSGGAAEASQTLTYRITSIPAFVSLFETNGTTPVALNDLLTLTQLQGLKYKTVADGSGAGNITWTIQDTGGTANGAIDTLTESLSVTVNGINDAPQRLAGAPAAVNVAEDSATTTAVALGLSGLAYGPGSGLGEASQTLTFKITAIPAFVDVFKADGTTAVAANSTLTLAELQGLKFKTTANTSGTGNLTWTVQDSGGTASGGIDTLSETLAVTVNAINDAPARTAGTPAAITVAEESGNTTAVTLGLTALTYGPGGGADEASQTTLTFKITAIPAFVEVFKTGSTTALAANDILTLAELQGLTYKTLANAAGTGSLTWTVQDSGGTANGGIDSLTETLAITVTGINDAPARTAGTPADITVAEDSANTTAVTLGLTALTYGPGGGTDEASPNQTLTFKITTIPAFVEVFKTGSTTAVAADDTLTLTELQSLTYKTLANAAGTGNLTWSVQDTGGTASGGIDSLTETLAITVTGINDAPARTAGAPAAITVAEDSANTTAVTLGLTTLAYGPGGGADEASPNQTLTFKITAIPAFVEVFNGATLVAADDTLTLTELQNLTYKTLANANGTGNLTWSVQDTGGTASGGIDTLTETLAITVTGINDAPARTAGAPAAITVDEDSANTTAVTLGLTALTYGPGGGTDEASPNQTLTFKITAIPAFVEVFKTGSTTALAANDTLTLTELQSLTYQTLADANGTGNLTWSVQDDGGTANGGVDSLTETLVITVNPVEGEGEAEGEGASMSAHDAAMLAYFASFDDFSTVGDTNWELSAADWEAAVDQAMSELA